jgi:hypothetical protein
MDGIILPQSRIYSLVLVKSYSYFETRSYFLSIRDIFSRSRMALPFKYLISNVNILCGCISQVMYIVLENEDWSFLKVTQII